MRVDVCDWTTARAKLAEMDSFNDRWHSLVSLPYKIGLTFGITGALSSIPLVFHKDTALWFNDTFVHEVPIPKLLSDSNIPQYLSLSLSLSLSLFLSLSLSLFFFYIYMSFLFPFSCFLSFFLSFFYRN